MVWILSLRNSINSVQALYYKKNVSKIPRYIRGHRAIIILSRNEK